MAEPINMIQPDIYQYDDFKPYLADLYRYLACEKKGYTQRLFAAHAGFANPGYLNDVVKGRRKLSNAAAHKMIAAFGLAAPEAKFFLLLVAYQQAKRADWKTSFYQRLLYCRSRSSFVRLNPSLVKYYQDYRYALIRNAVAACDFRGDFVKLAAFFDPALQPGLVERYVHDLQEWGLIRRETNGSFTVSSDLVEPPKTLLHLVKEANKEWVRQSLEAADRLSAEQRHISTMIVAVGKKNYALIQKKIETLRAEIFELTRQDQKPECVAQISIQLLPKTRTEA